MIWRFPSPFLRRQATSCYINNKITSLPQQEEKLYFRFQVQLIYIWDEIKSWIELPWFFFRTMEDWLLVKVLWNVSCWDWSQWQTRLWVRTVSGEVWVLWVLLSHNQGYRHQTPHSTEHTCSGSDTNNRCGHWQFITTKYHNQYTGHQLQGKLSRCGGHVTQCYVAKWGSMLAMCTATWQNGI